MDVSGVNSVSFAGRATTKNGNEYKKTNAGKITGGIVGTAGYGSLAYIISKREGGFKKACSDFTKAVIDEAKINGSELNESRMLKATKIGGVLGVLAGIGICVGLGAIVDAVINHHRAKKADKAASAE